MTIPGTPVLNVTLRFGSDDLVPVGRVALERGVALLEYDRAFIASGLEINSIYGALSSELVRARQPRTFDGLHGVFADSLPEAWGTLLMRRRAIALGIDDTSLTVLDRLAAVGSRGMGALTYEPDRSDAHDDGIDLDILAAESTRILEGRDSDVIAQLARLGGSSGGARPKIHVA